MLNEFFNELAYNPGPKKAGFLFFLDWGNHDLNSVVSSSDANGPLGRSLVYFNCEVLPILKGVAEVNPTVKVLVGLLRPPTKTECEGRGPDRHGRHESQRRERQRRLRHAAAGTAAAGSSVFAVPPHSTSFSQLTPVKAGSSSATTRRRPALRRHRALRSRASHASAGGSRASAHAGSAGSRTGGKG